MFASVTSTENNSIWLIAPSMLLYLCLSPRYNYVLMAFQILLQMC